MKKKAAWIMLFVLLAGLIPAACIAQEDHLHIVCTTFPQYDWTRRILGDQMQEVELTLLLDSRVDMHSYQPSARDIITISGCDLLIHVGGESDVWVQDVLRVAQKSDRRVISLVDCVYPQEDHVHDHAHDHEHDEADEHVWLSLRYAQKIVEEIAKTLCALRPQDADTFASNAQMYIAELKALDAQYAEMVGCAERGEILFADRFAFRCLAQDYGLECFAAFSGCSAESEASFETIVSLAQTADRLNLPAMLILEETQPTIAKTVIANTARNDQQILRMNSLQSVTREDVQNGLTYLGAMQENFRILEQALN